MASYWGEKGKYQSLYNVLYGRLVPDEDEATTEHGELLRCISRMYYDLFNNGMMNFAVLDHYNIPQKIVDNKKILLSFAEDKKKVEEFLNLLGRMHNLCDKKFTYFETDIPESWSKEMETCIDAVVDAVVLYCQSIEQVELLPDNRPVVEQVEKLIGKPNICSCRK